MATSMSGKGQAENRKICPATLVVIDPDSGEVCQRERQQKIGGRWDHAACGNPAEFSLAISRPNRDELGDRMPVCRVCFGEIVKDLMGHLV